MARMSFHSFDSPTRSWGYIACTVVAIHISLITLSFFAESSTPPPSQKTSRLVVQTVDLSPDTLLALVPTPLLPNPIKRSPLPPHPLDKTPLPPTPLERKTMKQEPLTPARTPDVPPRPAPTPEPEPEPKPEIKESAAELQGVKPTPKAPPLKKPEPARKSQTTPKSTEPATSKSPKPVKKVDAKAKKSPTSSKKTGPPSKPTPKKTPPPAKNDELKKKQAEEVEAQKQKLEAEAQKKKAELERQQKFLADAQEKMSKIGGNRNQTSQKTTSSSLSSLPNAIADLHIEALPAAKGAPPLSQREVTYRDELVGRLKLQLKLPEYGDVKVSLTLNRSGGVDKVTILSAESSANKKYIEKTLPNLSFPAFGANFDSLPQYTFTITLSNE